MQITEFQKWIRDTDRDTQWDLLTTPQILSHLTEEIGEVAQSVNRIYGYSSMAEREEHLANLEIELVEAFWLLAKLANRFDIDFDGAVEHFVDCSGEWLHKYRYRLMRGLQSLDSELSRAKSSLDL
jgi:NTP pyrophosphatase (non-canonical NTP hydrolase)